MKKYVLWRKSSFDAYIFLKDNLVFINWISLFQGWVLNLLEVYIFVVNKSAYS